MSTFYTEAAGVFLTLTALCGWLYVRAGRDRTALAMTGICAALAITAIASAVKPALLAYLWPVSLVTAVAAWWLKRRDPKAPKP